MLEESISASFRTMTRMRVRPSWCLIWLMIWYVWKVVATMVCSWVECGYMWSSRRLRSGEVCRCVYLDAIRMMDINKRRVESCLFCMSNGEADAAFHLWLLGLSRSPSLENAFGGLLSECSCADLLFSVCLFCFCFCTIYVDLPCRLFWVLRFLSQYCV